MERIFQKIFLFLLFPLALLIFKILSKKGVRKFSLLKLIGSFAFSCFLASFLYKSADAEVKQQDRIRSSPDSHLQHNKEKKSNVTPGHWYYVKLGTKVGVGPVIEGTKAEVAIKLLDFIEDPDLDIRKTALRILPDFADSSICPQLLGILERSESKEIYSGIHSLILKLDDLDCIQQSYIIFDQKEQKRLAVFMEKEQKRLAAIKEKKEDVPKIRPEKYEASVSKLIEHLNDAHIDPQEQTETIRALAGLKVRETVPHLINYLFQKDTSSLNLTIWALGEIRDERATKHLIPFISHEKRQVKKSAIEALGKIKSAQSLNALKKNLNNPDILIKVYSAISLARAGESSGAKVLLSMLEASLEKNRNIDKYETIFDLTLRNISNLSMEYFSHLELDVNSTQAQQLIFKRLTQDRKLLRKIAEVPDNLNVAHFLTDFSQSHPDYRVHAYSFFAFYMAKRPVSKCEKCRTMSIGTRQPVLRIEGIDEKLCSGLTNYFKITPINYFEITPNPFGNIFLNKRAKAREFVNILEKTQIEDKASLGKILEDFAKKLKIKY